MSEGLPAVARKRVAVLPRWQRRLFYGTAVGLVASGLSWLVGHYLLASDGEFGATEHPLAHWSLVAHGISAYGLVLAIGSLVPLHILAAWRLRRNRGTGAAMLTLAATLIGSGLWLYYGPVGGRSFVSTAHWLVGLASIALWWAHRRAGQSPP